MSTSELVPLNREDYEAAAVAERARFMPLMRMEDALARREVIVQAFNRLMKDGEDYGKIPGAGNKPTLLQPGAQKLDNMFGLVPRFVIDEREEDWTGERHGAEPFFRYLIRCQLYRGEFIAGEAIGECNSWESKYRWRTAERRCPKCGVGAIIKTKKNSWWCAPFKGGCGQGFPLTDKQITDQETGRKPNAEIFDQVNTLLKMAQKRAHVAATINATSASEFFTQDLEDSREPESAPAHQADQGNGSAQTTTSRPVPEELQSLFADLDKNPKEATARSFKMLEEVLRRAGGANGIEEYNRIVKALRAKHPQGSIIPMEAIKNCLLDLFSASETAKPPEGFQATDADLPKELQK